MKNFITVDGNTAAARIAYELSDMALIYPITPSSPMAEYVDELASVGKKNCFGNVVHVTEMQSEAGAAGALHGALTSGALATTFTSSQGLLLMIPNMYKIAGELLPCVINVAARTVATHALSIFGDHSDVMATRTTGFALLASSSVQEAQDMALASYLTTVQARVPFLHFFDGFRTSHEINKIESISQETICSLIDHDAVNAFRSTALSSDHPTERGTAQNGDVFFQNREASNPFYERVPALLTKTFEKIYKSTGRKYKLFDYVGEKDATDVIIAMGSGVETIEETITHLNKNGAKLGLIKVRLYRPFSAKHLLSVLPKTTKRISVLDRTKESGAIGEPLYMDVLSALSENGLNHIQVLGGRYGLSGKNFNPDQVYAIVQNMQSSKPKNHFSVGITDDISNTSLPIKNHIVSLPADTIECKFYGLGSDGTVSANKNSIKIIGDNTPLYSQAYFVYDSKKSGSITTSHLRFGSSPIKSTYYTENANIIAVHSATYVKKFDPLTGIKEGGIFLLNCPWRQKELDYELPASMKQKIAKMNLKMFIIDANKIAKEIGLNNRINTIMQACFFKLTGILPWEKAKTEMKKYAEKSYSKKGSAVVQMNFKAIDSADKYLTQVEIPKSWKTAKTGANVGANNSSPYFNDIIEPILTLDGDSLPVSAFSPNGEVPTGTTSLEKRNIAQFIPKWIAENCIQCNQCALVCPHACIRPYLVDSGSEISKKLGGKPALGIPGKDFVIQVSPMDCTGCENCAHTCPAMKKALEMIKADEFGKVENEKYELVKNITNHQNTFKDTTVKGSQFKTPLFEFSGACAGCGETPYIKLLTQLYGEKLIIANATGCSSIYGGSNPTCPYAKNENGKGPAWSNSLFEDNAEFGYGIYLAQKKNTESLTIILENAIKQKLSTKLKGAIKSWLEGNKTDAIASTILSLSNKEDYELFKNIYALNACLTDKTIWMIGGDGWAYDIGFSGIDHILNSNEKVRILVLDTEVYSNTGGQASKATPMGSVAKFAANGKTTHKKDLGAIAMTYPNCYVASVSMGANQNQVIQALTEAENHNGPSIVIAYCPCVNHGVDLSRTQEYEKNAVLSGYWQLYRYNPAKVDGDRLTIDPPFASKDYAEYAENQGRYFILKNKNPERSKNMITSAKNFNKQKFESRKK